MTHDAKTCPRCAEDVKAAAQVCRYCGHEFAPGHGGQRTWWIAAGVALALAFVVIAVTGFRNADTSAEREDRLEKARRSEAVICRDSSGRTDEADSAEACVVERDGEVVD